MNEYFIEDKYNYKDYNFLYKVLDRAIKYLDLKNVSFSVILTDDDEIKTLNKEHRNIDKATDVLSFQLDMVNNLPIKLLGDIYISVDQMKRQAIEYETGEERELSFLCIHGLLHLLGYDHLDDESEKEMILMQKEILGG